MTISISVPIPISPRACPARRCSYETTFDFLQLRLSRSTTAAIAEPSVDLAEASEQYESRTTSHRRRADSSAAAGVAASASASARPGAGDAECEGGGVALSAKLPTVPPSPPPPPSVALSDAVGDAPCSAASAISAEFADEFAETDESADLGSAAIFRVMLRGNIRDVTGKTYAMYAGKERKGGCSACSPSARRRRSRREISSNGAAAYPTQTRLTSRCSRSARLSPAK